MPTTSSQRRGASAIAWTAFNAGIVVSVAANVAHVHFAAEFDDGARYASMVSAAIWPLLLALCVEVVSRVSYPRGWRWWLPGYMATVVVGVVAAVVSYQHMHSVLLAFGESRLTAAIGPIAVDGLLIVGGFAILAIGETRRHTAATALAPAPAPAPAEAAQASTPIPVPPAPLAPPFPPVPPVPAESAPSPTTVESPSSPTGPAPEKHDATLDLADVGVPAGLQAKVLQKLHEAIESGRDPQPQDLAEVGIPAGMAGRVITRAVNGSQKAAA